MEKPQKSAVKEIVTKENQLSDVHLNKNSGGKNQ